MTNVDGVPVNETGPALDGDAPGPGRNTGRLYGVGLGPGDPSW